MSSKPNSMSFIVETVGAETKSFCFNRTDLNKPSEFVTYLGSSIDHTFHSITINNRTGFQATYCIEDDANDLITPVLAGGDGMIRIYSGEVHKLDFQQPRIKRFRIYVDGAGEIDVSLFFDPSR